MWLKYSWRPPANVSTMKNVPGGPVSWAIRSITPNASTSLPLPGGGVTGFRTMPGRLPLDVRAKRQAGAGSMRPNVIALTADANGAVVAHVEYVGGRPGETCAAWI